MTSNGLVDIFISKLDSDGNFVWAKSMGAEDDDEALSIKIDDDGNIYTTGYFFGAVDFDPGPATNILTAQGGYDIYVLKLDSDGNFVWAKSMGSPEWEFGFSVDIDDDGNVYSTGYFISTADFDPGPGIYELTAAGNYDAYISKLDADGNFVWAKRIGGTMVDYGFVVAVNDGNVYATGSFYGTPDFDPGAGVYELTSAGTYDIFYLKLDTDGNFIWAKNTGGTLFDYVNSMVVDAAGDIYSTGYFQGTSDFDPGDDELNLTVAGMNDIFITKLNTDGELLWVQSIGGPTNELGVSICLDQDGKITTTGYYTGMVDFDPGAGVSELTTAGDLDTYILKLANTVEVTSIDDATSAQTNLYPNPGYGNFEISSDQVINSVKIFNTEGKLIYQNDPGQANTSFTLVNNGIYFIQIIGEGQTRVLKLVVEN